MVLLIQKEIQVVNTALGSRFYLPSSIACIGTNGFCGVVHCIVLCCAPAAMDMYLDLDHHHSEARASYRYLLAWRDYMPYDHHRFLDMLEADMRANRDKGRTIRTYIMRLSPEDGMERWLRDVYSKVVDNLSRFRTTHLGIVALYIMNQQVKYAGSGLEAAPGGKGTGGMDLANFLKPLRDHSRRKAISSDMS